MHRPVVSAENSEGRSRRIKFQGLLSLQGEFKASLGNLVRPCLKIEIKQKKEREREEIKKERKREKERETKEREREREREMAPLCSLAAPKSSVLCSFKYIAQHCFSGKCL